MRPTSRPLTGQQLSLLEPLEDGGGGHGESGAPLANSDRKACGHSLATGMVVESVGGRGRCTVSTPFAMWASIPLGSTPDGTVNWR